jgi:hypothetical protein
MSHVKISNVLKNSSGKVVYQWHEMLLIVKFHSLDKAHEITDCKTSSFLMDFLKKTMNDELRLRFKFCCKLQTKVSLKLSECVMY